MKKYFSLLLLTATMVSCKKEDLNLDYTGIQPIVLVPNTNWPGQTAYPSLLQDSSYGVTHLQLYARVSYVTALDKPVTVTFQQTPELLAAYNSKWGTSYEALPAAAFALAGSTLTIPAGVQQASLPITILPGHMQAGKSYLIAFSIKEAAGQTVAANANSIIFTLQGP